MKIAADFRKFMATIPRGQPSRRFHTVSQQCTLHGAFDAGYREQTSEGNHQRKGGYQCPFSKN
jgi:hypothetical protein